MLVLECSGYFSVEVSFCEGVELLLDCEMLLDEILLLGITVHVLSIGGPAIWTWFVRPLGLVYDFPIGAPFGISWLFQADDHLGGCPLVFKVD